MAVVIETTVGDFTIDLLTEERPRASLNFLKLCKTKYYNFCLFYTVERNFTAQTGDPTGTGRGGESIFSQLYGDQAKFFEAETKPRLKHTDVGTVSMINNGENMHGAQFFVTLGENLDFLDGTHTVFGHVTEGLDTLMKINDTICDDKNKPYQDIRITHTVILDDPYDDPAGLIVPCMSPEPTKELLATSRIGVHEEIDDTKGKSIEEIEEEIRDKEAKSRATILEMVGDIPDAEIRPPDNVLFVCKLNPVTTAEDLEVIFSRFGSILSCEVIKDRKSGESLQYAFIEFENPEECENAYFKMDNVLIDDRRIHVDFSQSVSKLNWNEMRKNAQNSFKKPQFKLKNDKFSQSHDKKYDLIFDDNAPEKSNDDKPHSNRRNDKQEKSSSHKARDYSYSKHTVSSMSSLQSKRRYRSHSRSRERTSITKYRKEDRSVGTIKNERKHRHSRRSSSADSFEMRARRHHSSRSSKTEKNYKRSSPPRKSKKHERQLDSSDSDKATASRKPKKHYRSRKSSSADRNRKRTYKNRH